MRVLILTLLFTLIIVPRATALQDENDYEREIERRVALLTRLGLEIADELKVGSEGWNYAPMNVVKYGSQRLEAIVYRGDEVYSLGLQYVGTDDQIDAEFNAMHEFAPPPVWRDSALVGDRALVADGCDRAWVRFSRGPILVLINANENRPLSTEEAAAEARGDCYHISTVLSRRLLDNAIRLASKVDTHLRAAELAVAPDAAHT